MLRTINLDNGTVTDNGKTTNIYNYFEKSDNPNLDLVKGINGDTFLMYEDVPQHMIEDIKSAFRKALQ